MEKKYDPNSMESILARFNSRDTTGEMNLIKPSDDSLDQSTPIPIQSKRSSMTKAMEQGHIDSIALCRIQVDKSPDSEIYAIEMLDIIDNRQYLKVVNADVARTQQPVDMDEGTFQTMMVNTVVAQLKKDENIGDDHAFYCLFIEDAKRVATMRPVDLHNMYMFQIQKLHESMNPKKVEVKEEESHIIASETSGKIVDINGKVIH